MSTFGLFIVIVVVVAGLIGWQQGLLKQVGRLAGIILGIIACRLFGPVAVGLFVSADATNGDKILYTIIAYILLFVIVYVAVTLVARLFKALLDTVKLGIINNVAGAVFNITEWIFMLSLLLNLWTKISPITSLVGDPLYDNVLWFAPYLLNTDAVIKIGSAITGAVTG